MPSGEPGPSEHGSVSIVIVRQVKRRWIVIALACSIAVVYYTWRWLEPWYWIYAQGQAARDAEPGEQARAEEHLRSLGTRAIDPIIEELKSSSPWSKSTFSLPYVLASLGQDAHKRLLRAVDGSTSVHEQIALIHVLHKAFRDYSRANIWVEAIEREPGSAFYLQHDLEYEFGIIPPVVKDRHLSREFLRWYRGHSVDGQPLPKLRRVLSSNMD